jgi:uncharacterized repeat protein (TIGR03843 family)
MVTADNRDEILAALGYGDLKVTGRLVDASNATLFGEINVGEHSFNCIYKPVTGERPLWDFPDGTLANREYAAYLISEAMKLNCVPPTLLREGPFGFGMVQLWIDIDEEIDLAELYRQDLSGLRNLALVDVVINNTDRKIGHLLPTSDGHIYGCDHGVTFHAEDKLRTVLWQWEQLALLESELAMLETLDAKLDGQVGEQIKELITTEEFKALRKRVSRLQMMKVFPSPSPDWPAVPWPPF